MDTTAQQRQRETKEHLGRDLEKEMETAGFMYSWKKIEVAAQDKS